MLFCSWPGATLCSTRVRVWEVILYSRQRGVPRLTAHAHVICMCTALRPTVAWPASRRRYDEKKRSSIIASIRCERAALKVIGLMFRLNSSLPRYYVFCSLECFELKKR